MLHRSNISIDLVWLEIIVFYSEMCSYSDVSINQLKSELSDFHLSKLHILFKPLKNGITSSLISRH